MYKYLGFQFINRL